MRVLRPFPGPTRSEGGSGAQRSVCSKAHSHLRTAVLVNSPLPLPFFFFQLLHSTKHLVGNVFICYSFIHSVLAGDLLSPG